MKYRKGVFIVTYAVVRKKPKYLVLHRKLHWKGWEFPKGGRLAREKLENAVKREIKEETGLGACDIRKFSVDGKFIYDKKTQAEKNRKGFIFCLYSCRISKKKVKIACEHDNYKWLGFLDALRLLTWKNQKKCLKIVDKWLKN